MPGHRDDGSGAPLDINVFGRRPLDRRYQHGMAREGLLDRAARILWQHQGEREEAERSRQRETEVVSRIVNFATGSFASAAPAAAFSSWALGSQAAPTPPWAGGTGGDDLSATSDARCNEVDEARS